MTWCGVAVLSPIVSLVAQPGGAVNRSDCDVSMTFPPGYTGNYLRVVEALKSLGIGSVAVRSSHAIVNSKQSESAGGNIPALLEANYVGASTVHECRSIAQKLRNLQSQIDVHLLALKNREVWHVYVCL